MMTYLRTGILVVVALGVMTVGMAIIMDWTLLGGYDALHASFSERRYFNSVGFFLIALGVFALIAHFRRRRRSRKKRD